MKRPDGSANYDFGTLEGILVCVTCVSCNTQRMNNDVAVMKYFAELNEQFVLEQLLISQLFLSQTYTVPLTAIPSQRVEIPCLQVDCSL